MHLYLYAFIGYELFQIKLYITILRFQFCIINQQNGLCWSKGQPKDLKKLKVIYCFGFFCVAPFWCAANCFGKKCGKETWDLKAAITTNSCSFEPMIPQLEALWGITPGICLKQSVFGLVHHKHSKHIHQKDRARKENTQMDAEKNDSNCDSSQIYIYVPNITQTTISRLSFSRTFSTKHVDTYSLGMR